MNKPIKFSENLKYYRTKLCLTQRQLAKHIGYTEKSVSKWENGNGLPPMEMLLKLADLFKISLDELVFEKTTCNYFLGIDGGGTKTVFKLIDENGTTLNKIYKGSCNPNDIGIENAFALLKDGINEACRGIPFANITMFAGISGGGLTGNNNKMLSRFFDKFGFFAFDNGSDIENLVALSEQEKCILIIMGTGFVVYALDAEKRKRISGWGQFFDEGGSGYTLGKDAITAALCEIDGSGEKTLLTTLFSERLGETVEGHLAKFYQGGKRYIASFADLVFAAAEQGDKIAFEILEKNMKFVAHRINTAAAEFTNDTPDQIPVLFSGGISMKNDLLFPLIEKHITAANCNLISIQSEPVDGALRKAKKIFEIKAKETEKGE